MTPWQSKNSNRFIKRSSGKALTTMAAYDGGRLLMSLMETKFVN